MKKILGLALLALVGCKTTSKVIDPIPPQLETVYEVSEANVAETLKYLSSDELEGRDSGSKGIEKAAVYLENQLKQNGIKPYFSSYRDTLTNYKTISYNVVGYIEGNDKKLKNEVVILGAHYDHIGITPEAKGEDKINNGANDNASGTTVLSEIAKYLGTFKTNKRSVLIVYFSAEEKGLLGSYHLAKKLKEKGVNVYTLLNFEMLGVPMNYDYDMFITGYDFSNMATKLNEYAESTLVGKSEMAEKYNLFKASDNYPFYEQFGIPSHTISAFDFSNFNYYHHPKDEFQEMDTQFMTKLANKMLPVVTKMINADTQEIKMNNQEVKK
ncbi:M28 family peptidase [Flavobacterium sp. xlx-214]|uniref:M28 family peptidase n=1 Tax=unclassified Flavobacterium TaxID=196869 RepID=UPI0013CFA3DC|nr:MULTISPECIES: M28 family peptidase [unclassified Flavobacterium]MBA5794100.1 M28 family peptidase [Flavobacterium sp. xlx-221]QMI84009.1 M28 family peptidase [Flavobacterium sp. xlx-214]